MRSVVRPFPPRLALLAGFPLMFGLGCQSPVEPATVGVANSSADGNSVAPTGTPGSGSYTPSRCPGAHNDAQLMPNLPSGC